MESQQRNQVEVKPTWRLAWGLFWRMFLIELGVAAVIWLIVLIVAVLIGISLTPW